MKKPPISGVYKITNAANGKVYVGSSIRMHYRWHQHRWYLNKGVHKTPRLQNAWKKYGPDAFVFEVIEVAPTNALAEREMFWIEKLNATDRERGYNTFAKVAALTKDVIARLGQSKKGRKLSPEHAAAIGRGRTGIKMSREFGEKQRQLKTGKKYSPRSAESKKRSSAAITKWHAEAGLSHEVRMKIARTRKLRDRLRKEADAIPGIFQ